MLRKFIKAIENKGLKPYNVAKDVCGDYYYFKWSKENEALINEVYDSFYKYNIKHIRVAYLDDDRLMVWESILN